MSNMSKNSAAVDLILASRSPRRIQLLKQIGVRFQVLPPDVDESPLPAEQPSDYVRRIALLKSAIVSELCEGSNPVLAADTAVSIDKLILGKPDSEDHAREMLERLSDRWHEVYSGIAVTHRDVTVISVRTRVKFRRIDRWEISQYWQSGEPQDKAGSYTIQGSGGNFVERIDGSYSNVVGLPMVETGQLLDKYGIGRRLGAGTAYPDIE